jgi:hypothetical protein
MTNHADLVIGISGEVTRFLTSDPMSLLKSMGSVALNCKNAITGHTEESQGLECLKNILV